MKWNEWWWEKGNATMSSVDSVRVCDSSVMECEGCVRGVGVRGVREGSGERSTCGEWVRGVREGSG